MRRSDLSKLLFENMKIVEPYPEGVSPVNKMLDGTAFFPGGEGLWNNNMSVVSPSILVLGQDFSTEAKYNDMINHISADLESPTWRNMIRLFEEANIDLEDCFFSNVFMGLRKSKSMTGVFPGFKNKEFVNRNSIFLSYQISSINPRIIITLGKYAAEMLADLAGSDLDAWKNWKALRNPDVGVKFNVSIKGQYYTCVALEHPSMRNSNVNRRRHKNYNGNDAEIMMLKDALYL